jgi:nucleotide-binding universal stress UspA family protein
LQKVVFGSTTESVLRETTTPVLVTPPERPTSTSLSEIARHVHRVLAPLDLSAASPRQLRIAAAIAEGLSVPLLVAHVLEPILLRSGVRTAMPGIDTARRVQVESRLNDLAASIPGHMRPEYLVSSGDTSEEIVRLAEARAANLIVMGLHASGFLGPRMGSVTYRVLCSTRALVVALPPVSAAKATGNLNTGVASSTRSTG